MDIETAIDIVRDCVDSSSGGELSKAVFEMCNYIWKQDRKIEKVKEILEDINNSHNADKSASLAQSCLKIIK